MKKVLSFLLVLSLLLSGCAALADDSPKLYNATYLDLFDTVTTIVGTGESQSAFNREAQKLYEQLERYHQLFDIYKDYEGIANLKTVNDNAGVAPVKVDSAIIELLLACREYYRLTEGRVNVAMGSVLQLWHEARTAGLADPENARLPDGDALAMAMTHTDITNVFIDKEASTVYIADPELSLDVGAIAKGWATQRVAEMAPEGMLLSVGGNVCATGPKDDDGSPWVIGVQNPDGGDYLRKLQITDGAAVTSGDYQRTYEVNGKQYHHIIDPETGMPSEHWRSVTVICEDSALADCLSTALFLLPLEEGKALAAQCNARVLWLDRNGIQHTTEDFQKHVVQ